MGHLQINGGEITTSIDQDTMNRAADARDRHPIPRRLLPQRSSLPSKASGSQGRFYPGPADALPNPNRAFVPAPEDSLKHGLVINIESTDASSSNWPEFTSIEGNTPAVFYRIDDEAGNELVSRLERISRAKQVERWKTKIGSYIGNKLDPDVPQDAVPGSQGWKQYKLVDLPEGYGLFKQQRSTGVRTSHRMDAYLLGSNTVVRFRSPEEFYEHALWLYMGKEGLCGCQYCKPDYAKRGAKKRISHPMR